VTAFPEFTTLDVPNHGILSAPQPRLFIVHSAEYVGDGTGLAAYCRSNPNGYVWHWSVGNTGKAWRHLGVPERGAHAACVNSMSNGAEQSGYTAWSRDKWLQYPKQLDTLAWIISGTAKLLRKRPVRRVGQWPGNDELMVISHREASQFYGGCSTHTDPGAGFPWDVLMQRIDAHFSDQEVTFLAALTEEEQHFMSDFIVGMANGFWVESGKNPDDKPGILTGQPPSDNERALGYKIGQRLAKIGGTP
jgi:hypothetical protein